MNNTMCRLLMLISASIILIIVIIGQPVGKQEYIVIQTSTPTATPTPTPTITPTVTPVTTYAAHSTYLASRGSVDRVMRVMRVTAYDLSYDSCGKYPSHPEYGITASGKEVKQWHTVAVGKNMKFGTRIYIPYFRDEPNGGIFVVEDRGGAIGNDCIDIYMSSHSDCMRFGVRYLDVYILE